MKQILTLLLLAVVLGPGAFGQHKSITLTGQLTDSLEKQQLQNATVSLVNSGDSSLVAFTRTDDSGRFSFSKLLPGNYRLAASQVNFHPLWKHFSLDSGQPVVDLGRIAMADKTLLTGVTVVSSRPPVVVNGDTLEFNAEAFKTRPNAVVEDMLKKMPGVEVGRDGSILVNGQPIRRVLVNGKDFFNGDPKMATRNLPADALDKVQVFDKQSDQAAFTGVDDGNAEKTINLKLKKDKNNAAFGKATAAAGTNERLDGQFNVNRFNGSQQLSVIGMANNTNRQGFSIMDMLNFTGQNRKMMSGGGGITIRTGSPDEFGLPVDGINNNQGITKTIAGGVNYNDTWNKRTEVNASYLHSNITVDNNRSSLRQNILPGNNFTTTQQKASSNNAVANRLNLAVDHRIDSFNSIKLTSLFGYQEGGASVSSTYASFESTDKKLNNGSTNTNTATDGYTINNTLLYRHKFKKRGRTVSLTGTMQYNNSSGNSDQNAINQYFANGSVFSIDTINQVTGINSITGSYGVSANYTEPLSKKSLLEFRSYYNTSQGTLDRKTYDYNKGSGKHDLVNKNGSSAFVNDYDYAGAGTSFRMQQKKYSLSAGANVQQGTLKSQLKDSSFLVKQTFTNVLPVASFNYNFTKMKNMRLDYSTSINQPSAAQLQPVKDISDPLYIRQGNPSLRQEYLHALSLQFFHTNPAQQKNLFAFVNFLKTQNAIVNSDQLIGGTRTSTPVNAVGAYNILGNINRGFGVRKWNTRFTYGGSVNFNSSVNFINGQENKTSNLSVTPRISATYSYKEKIDVSVAVRYTFNNARYSLSPAFNNEYSRIQYDLDATFNLPKGFTISNDIGYTGFAGRANGFNSRLTLWNAYISKQILKSKKGEIRLSVFDLLKQQNGIDRTANSNYIEDIRYRTLRQYYTLGFTYSLQKQMAGGPRAVLRAL